MTWTSPAVTDLEVRVWMEKHRWPVSYTFYDADRKIFAWRHDAHDRMYTLRVSRHVLENTPAPDLVAALDSCGVAKLLSENPRAYTWVRGLNGSAAVEQRDGPPDAGE